MLRSSFLALIAVSAAGLTAWDVEQGHDLRGDDIIADFVGGCADFFEHFAEGGG
ncbi:MAG: hypothetical protein AAF799_25765 [Myxococcota bacterium]